MGVSMDVVFSMKDCNDFGSRDLYQIDSQLGEMKTRKFNLSASRQVSERASGRHTSKALHGFPSIV